MPAEAIYPSREVRKGRLYRQNDDISSILSRKFIHFADGIEGDSSIYLVIAGKTFSLRMYLRGGHMNSRGLQFLFHDPGTLLIAGRSGKLIQVDVFVRLSAPTQGAVASGVFQIFSDSNVEGGVCHQDASRKFSVS